MTFTVQPGFPEDQRDRAASLYWQAFRGKLGPIMRPEDRALSFLREVMHPDHALCAVDQSGTLLGLAGFKTRQGALVGGTMGDLARAYGLLGALWRAPLLSLLERKQQAGVLLMDGICVAHRMRGRGVGTALLSAVKAEAARRGCQKLRLDVIDTNPRAEALYRTQGFVPVARETLGPLRHLFGFNSALQMEFSVPDT